MRRNDAMDAICYCYKLISEIREEDKEMDKKEMRDECLAMNTQIWKAINEIRFTNQVNLNCIACMWETIESLREDVLNLSTELSKRLEILENQNHKCGCGKKKSKPAPEDELYLYTWMPNGDLIMETKSGFKYMIKSAEYERLRIAEIDLDDVLKHLLKGGHLHELF